MNDLKKTLSLSNRQLHNLHALLGTPIIPSLPDYSLSAFCEDIKSVLFQLSPDIQHTHFELNGSSKFGIMNWQSVTPNDIDINILCITRRSDDLDSLFNSLLIEMRQVALHLHVDMKPTFIKAHVHGSHTFGLYSFKTSPPIDFYIRFSTISLEIPSSEFDHNACTISIDQPVKLMSHYPISWINLLNTQKLLSRFSHHYFHCGLLRLIKYLPDGWRPISPAIMPRLVSQFVDELNRVDGHMSRSSIANKMRLLFEPSTLPNHAKSIHFLQNIFTLFYSSTVIDLESKPHIRTLLMLPRSLNASNTMCDTPFLRYIVSDSLPEMAFSQFILDDINKCVDFMIHIAPTTSYYSAEMEIMLKNDIRLAFAVIHQLLSTKSPIIPEHLIDPSSDSQPLLETILNALFSNTGKDISHDADCLFTKLIDHTEGSHAFPTIDTIIRTAMIDTDQSFPTMQDLEYDILQLPQLLRPIAGALCPQCHHSNVSFLPSISWAELYPLPWMGSSNIVKDIESISHPKTEFMAQFLHHVKRDLYSYILIESFPFLNSQSADQLIDCFEHNAQQKARDILLGSVKSLSIQDLLETTKQSSSIIRFVNYLKPIRTDVHFVLRLRQLLHISSEFDGGIKAQLHSQLSTDLKRKDVKEKILALSSSLLSSKENRRSLFKLVSEWSTDHIPDTHYSKLLYTIFYGILLKDATGPLKNIFTNDASELTQFFEEFHLMSIPTAHNRLNTISTLSPPNPAHYHVINAYFEHPSLDEYSPFYGAHQCIVDNIKSRCFNAAFSHLPHHLQSIIQKDALFKDYHSNDITDQPSLDDYPIEDIVSLWQKNHAVLRDMQWQEKAAQILEYFQHLFFSYLSNHWVTDHSTSGFSNYCQTLDERPTFDHYFSFCTHTLSESSPSEQIMFLNELTYFLTSAPLSQWPDFYYQSFVSLLREHSTKLIIAIILNLDPHNYAFTGETLFPSQNLEQARLHLPIDLELILELSNWLIAYKSTFHAKGIQDIITDLNQLTTQMSQIIKKAGDYFTTSPNNQRLFELIIQHCSISMKSPPTLSFHSFDDYLTYFSNEFKTLEEHVYALDYQDIIMKGFIFTSSVSPLSTDSNLIQYIDANAPYTWLHYNFETLSANEFQNIPANRQELDQLLNTCIFDIPHTQWPGNVFEQFLFFYNYIKLLEGQNDLAVATKFYDHYMCWLDQNVRNDYGRKCLEVYCLINIIYSTDRTKEAVSPFLISLERLLETYPSSVTKSYSLYFRDLIRLQTDHIPAFTDELETSDSPELAFKPVWQSIEMIVEFFRSILNDLHELKYIQAEPLEMMNVLFEEFTQCLNKLFMTIYPYWDDTQFTTIRSNLIIASQFMVRVADQLSPTGYDTKSAEQLAVVTHLYSTEMACNPLEPGPVSFGASMQTAINLIKTIKEMPMNDIESQFYHWLLLRMYALINFQDVYYRSELNYIRPQKFLDHYIRSNPNIFPPELYTRASLPGSSPQILFEINEHIFLQLIDTQFKSISALPFHLLWYTQALIETYLPTDKERFMPLLRRLQDGIRTFSNELFEVNTEHSTSGTFIEKTVLISKLTRFPLTKNRYRHNKEVELRHHFLKTIFDLKISTESHIYFQSPFKLSDRMSLIPLADKYMDFFKHNAQSQHDSAQSILGAIHLSNHFFEWAYNISKDISEKRGLEARFHAMKPFIYETTARLFEHAADITASTSNTFSNWTDLVNIFRLYQNQTREHSIQKSILAAISNTIQMLESPPPISFSNSQYVFDTLEFIKRILLFQNKHANDSRKLVSELNKRFSRVLSSSRSPLLNAMIESLDSADSNQLLKQGNLHLEPFYKNSINYFTKKNSMDASSKIKDIRLLSAVYTRIYDAIHSSSYHLNHSILHDHELLTHIINGLFSLKHIEHIESLNDKNLNIIYERSAQSLSELSKGLILMDYLKLRRNTAI